MGTTYRTVDIKTLRVDSKYQRFVRPAAVNRLTKEWDDALAQTLVLNIRDDGDTYIIDGNHRVTAKLRRIEQGLDDNCWMMAQIYEDLPLDREAEVFTKLNGHRVNATPIDKFNAAVISGDRLSMIVDEALKANGMTCGYGKSKNILGAVGGCLQVAKSCGANDIEATEILTEALGICRDVYERFGKAAYRRENIEAIGMLMDRAYTVYPAEQVNARLRKVLLASDPYDLYLRGRSRAAGNNRPSAQVAQVMLEKYNFKLKRKTLPQWHEMNRRSARRI